MEWVETTGKSVDEAKNRALDQLGVAEDDAEIVVLDEPRAGLFGRVRGEARVRARVRPTTPRPKLDRRDRKKGAKGDKPDASDTADTTDTANTGNTADTADAPSKPARARGEQSARVKADKADKADKTGKADKAGKADTTGVAESGDDAPAAKPRRSRAAATVTSDGRDRDPFDVFEGGDGAAAGAGGSAGDDVVERPARSGSSRGGRQRKDGARATNAVSANNDQPKETNVDAEQVGEEARVFVQGVVDAFGLIGTAAVRRDEDDLEVTVDGSDLGLLVGPRGSTLQALQELTRVAAQRRLGDHDTRLRVDVGGYRERRREALTRFAHQVAEQVVADGTAKRLEPMSSSDRKVIHDVLSEFDGVVTRSEGDDPRRCVVIAPAND